MDSQQEYDKRHKRVNEFLDNCPLDKPISVDVTPEIQYYADMAWLEGYAQGKCEILDKIDGLLTNMNNKMGD